jgi:4-amino-4-deoxy-L-arabinose transferase-like glycosyltransferase
MSVGDGVRVPSRGVPAGARFSRGARRWPAVASLRLSMSSWSVYAWGAIAIAIGFIALTCWWLTQDRSIPVYDAGDHLETAFRFHALLVRGNLLGPFNYESPYPPLGTFIGALAVFVGGVNVASPIIGENLVFVPLLVLGCYRTGRLLFDGRAGLLAVIFVLGSPLLIDQLHVFMLDPPETALVAIAVWLLLESEDFSRIGFAAAAGGAVGLGMLTKVQFAPFVVGVILVALLRGGWRNKRGFVVFAAVALVLAMPWYLDHLAQFKTFTTDASQHQGVPVGDVPPTLSLANFAWYFWNILNSQFMAPLFAFIAVGTAWMGLTLFRHRREALAPGRGPFGVRLEFFAGAVVAWLLITSTPAHDIRYAMPLMPYLAIIATGWIVYMRRPVRVLAVALVLVGVGANTLSSTFGVAGTAQVQFVHPLPAGEELADSVRFYTNQGLLVSGPQRDGDVPGLLDDMHRDGVRTVAWSYEESTAPDFSFEGIFPLLRIAKIAGIMTATPEFTYSADVATLIHEPLSAQSPPTCTRLSDGTGMWIVRYDQAAGKLALYCPTRSPRYYSVGQVKEG